MPFRDDFVWGAATAAYQVEGAWNEEGRGPCVWDLLCAQPGRIWEGHDAKRACDHYHRYREDVALMRELGLQAYRFSVSWPRVMPEGRGAANAAGLDFYDRLVDALLEVGITPWVTLFHWDFPAALYHCGGWMNPESPRWFAEYTDCVVRRLGDRVRHWFTFNEPQCFLGLGLRDGRHAPGDRHGWAQVLLANHHNLLAHGRAVQVIRSHQGARACIGVAPVAAAKVPVSTQPADVEAARRSMFEQTQPTVWDIALWSDPVVLGRYPEHAAQVYGEAMPRFPDSDMALIRQPLDFYAFNIYGGTPVAADETGAPRHVSEPAGNPRSAFQWSVIPESMYWASRFFAERYQLPIVISENGIANQDWVALDGGVHDTQRSDYLVRHLAELRRAAEDGVDIRGYFHWSLLDNFEWAEGYKYRFGLVYVDYATQRRIPKDSARLYRDIIARNGADLPASGRFL